MDANYVCFLAATLLLIHLHQAPCVSIMSPTARDDRPELAHVGQRREKRCSCENQKDKECIFFCHIGIVWVNTPSHLVPYGFGSVRLRRNLSRCLCTQTEDAKCLSFCSFQSDGENDAVKKRTADRWKRRYRGAFWEKGAGTS
ncbi:endothelin-1 [Takifugu rubripes]|uniref:Endothelin-1-like n=1 Tax=Takifugu rubripes TaxID=31033 RepID=A0A3B5KH97_TAKRU|nr:endothelin-1-like [Takifugu rubripes]XP_011610079.1 endothelin-1-like [Takifugu rubripes]|eukprot:XP_011610077.1 PREDICTED: endothelin-1-like [Takifugu rubripes]